MGKDLELRMSFGPERKRLATVLLFESDLANLALSYSHSRRPPHLFSCLDAFGLSFVEISSPRPKT